MNASKLPPMAKAARSQLASGARRSPNSSLLHPLCETPARSDACAWVSLILLRPSLSIVPMRSPSALQCRSVAAWRGVRSRLPPVHPIPASWLPVPLIARFAGTALTLDTVDDPCPSCSPVPVVPARALRARPWPRRRHAPCRQRGRLAARWCTVVAIPYPSGGYGQDEPWDRGRSRLDPSWQPRECAVLAPILRISPAGSASGRR